MKKQLFLAESGVVFKSAGILDAHRTIRRIVAAENDFQAICLMEEHIRQHELLADDERLDLTFAHEAIGME